jgi:deazaflavin-dependent oxidoreductase (nitroreductase family)
MARTLGRIVLAVFVALGAVGTVFVLGMRAKSPAVLDAVRRTGRSMRPLALRTAGGTGSPTSVVRHVGRSSGREYDTPVGAVATDDGFVIALPYGTNTDWLRNVLAQGSATIVHDGAEHAVHSPRVVPLMRLGGHFSATDQRMHRIFGVEECLQVRRVPEAP